MINLQDYIDDSKLFKTIKVDELLFVEYQCLVEDRQSDIWTHDNYLAHVLSGQKKWKNPEGEWLTSAGETLFVRKGSSTVYQYFSEPFIVLFIFIPDEFIRSVVLKYPDLQEPTQNIRAITGPAYQHLMPVASNTVLDTFFQSLLAHFSSPKTGAKHILRLKLEELVLHMLVQPDNKAVGNYFRRLGNSRHTDVESVMNANFHRPLSIHEYARICNKSLASFRRHFEQTLRTTPGKWLTNKRLNYAKFLLLATDKSIQEVIDESGFENRSHFSRLFKDRFGTPPGQFRQTQPANG